MRSRLSSLRQRLRFAQRRVSARGGQLTRAMTVSCPSHTPPPPQRLSVAPMMDWTDLYYRQLARMLSRNVWLYTEMVVDSTLIHNTNHHRFLWFPPEQHPISCQLGGSNPESLAQAAAIVAKFGYDEINLNCGCPSDRVAGAGCFGAALMLRPELVAECCTAMSDAVEGQIPITVKCRLGVDNVDSYDALHKFIHVVSSRSPVRHFMIHARKCLLKGLNPAQNRSIPPLRYNWVWALKRDFPHLQFSLNGGILTLDQTIAALQLRTPIEDGRAVGGLEGVMVGRAAYNDPWGMLAGADVAIWGEESNPSKNRRELLRRYAVYADAMIGSIEIKEDGYKVPSVRTLVKPLLGMFHQERKGKKWRAAVDDALRKSSTVTEVLDSTLHVLLPETLDAPPRIPMVEEITFDACRKALIHFPPNLPFLDNQCQGEVQAHDVDQEQCAISV